MLGRSLRAVRPLLRPSAGGLLLPQAPIAAVAAPVTFVRQHGAAATPHPSPQQQAIRSELDSPARRGNSPSITPPSPAKMSIKFSLADDPGALAQALGYFQRHHVNIHRLESRPSKRGKDFDFYVDFLGSEAQPNVRAMLADLKEKSTSLQTLQSRRVPWFPRRAKELDLVANLILDAGMDLQSDHPGFNDPVYRARREELSLNARRFRHGEPIPLIKYAPEEIATWKAIYERLLPSVLKYGCAEHVNLLPLLQEHCGYSAHNIPQLQDISAFLKERTGFTIRPVAGLLSARNFLYGLAFRTFFSTQYLRHHSKPLYTPEPDLVHELMGHAPLFADRAFADFSQEIGLAAIGATDDQINKLARCYWHTVEFGMCRAEDGHTLKAYGAGLLSSFGELEYSQGLSEATDGKPEYREFDPFQAGEQDYPITTYQPIYYVARSFTDAKAEMQRFSNSFARSFHVRYSDEDETLYVDANLDLEDAPPLQK